MADLLCVTTDGYGKRTPVRDIPLTGRKRKGVRISFAELAGSVVVSPRDDVLLATSGGKVQRVPALEVPIRGRRSRGARLVALGAGETVTAVALYREVPETGVEVASWRRVPASDEKGGA